MKKIFNYAIIPILALAIVGIVYAQASSLIYISDDGNTRIINLEESDVAGSGGQIYEPTAVDLSDLTLAENSVYRGDASDNPEATSDLTILSNGNVGIGTDTPTSLLHAVQTSTTGSTGYFYRNLASASTDSPLMQLINDNAGDDQNVQTNQNDGTGDTLFLDTNGNTTSLNIDSEATTAGVFTLESLNTSGRLLLVRNYGAMASNVSNAVASFQQNSSSSGGITLESKNAGTGNTQFLDTNGDAISLNIDSESTTQDIVNIDGAPLTSGIALDVIGGASKTGTLGVARFLNSGDATNVSIDQKGNGISLNIDSEATTANVITVGTVNTDRGVKFFSTGAYTGTTNGGFILAELTNAASTQPVFLSRNAGSGVGLRIDNNGNGIGLEIDSEATSATVLNVTAENTSGNIMNIDSKLVMDYEGNVGISTTNPTEPFTVIGNSLLNSVLVTNADSSLSSSPYVLIARSSGAGSGIYADAGNLVLQPRGSISGRGTYILDGGGDINMSILDGGNVGIGTSTPEALFHVSEATATTTAEFGNDGGTSPSCMKFQDTDGAGWTYCTFLNGTMTCDTNSCE